MREELREVKEKWLGLKKNTKAGIIAIGMAIGFMVISAIGYEQNLMKTKNNTNKSFSEVFKQEKGVAERKVEKESRRFESAMREERYNREEKERTKQQLEAESELRVLEKTRDILENERAKIKAAQEIIKGVD